MKSLNSSKEVFNKTHGIQTEFFAEYFGGLDSWHKRIENLKVDFNFKNIKSLYETFRNKS